MATTASDSQVIMRQPQLIDIVDEAWAQDSLSDDGTYFFFQFFSSIDSNDATRRNRGVERVGQRK